MRLKLIGLALLLAAVASATPAPAAQSTGEGVFTRHVQGTARSDVYVVKTDGSGLRRLTRDGRSGAAAYSPDGRRVAFASGRLHGAHAPELYVIDADGRNVRRLTRTYQGRRAHGTRWRPRISGG